MDIVIDISIDKDEIYKPVIDDYDMDLVDTDTLELINEHKLLNKTSSVTDIDRLMHIAEVLQKTNDFDVFTINDIYSMESILEINNIIYPYKYAYIIKFVDQPFDYSFYIIAFEKNTELKMNSKIINNIDNIRDLIYLTVANAEVVLRKK